MGIPTGLRLLDELLERGDRRYEEGREQGLEKGLMRGKRAGILRILSHRSSTTPPAVAAGLLIVDDAAQLDALLDRALTAPSIAVFIQALPPSTT